MPLNKWIFYLGRKYFFPINIHVQWKHKENDLVKVKISLFFLDFLKTVFNKRFLKFWKFKYIFWSKYNKSSEKIWREFENVAKFWFMYGFFPIGFLTQFYNIKSLISSKTVVWCTFEPYYHWFKCQC